MSFDSKDLQHWYDAELKAHEPGLRRFLASKVPAGVEVDDIVQEAYFRIFRLKAAGQVRSSRALFYSIARNILLDNYRSKYEGREIFLGDLEAEADVTDENSAANDLLTRDEARLLTEAIRRLPKRCREIFILRNHEMLSYRDIAKRLKVSEKTVEAQLAIGARKCRQFLKSKGLP